MLQKNVIELAFENIPIFTVAVDLLVIDLYLGRDLPYIVLFSSLFSFLSIVKVNITHIIQICYKISIVNEQLKLKKLELVNSRKFFNLISNSYEKIKSTINK